MKYRVVLSVIFAARLAALAQTNCPPAAIAIYRNQTNTINPPAIDATAFENSAGFTVNASFIPYDFQNTLFFTNKSSGLMSSVSGFRFDYFACNRRSPADNFVNQGQISTSANLFVWATNITARGQINGGFAGRTRFEGENVNLSQLGISAGLSDTTSFFGGFFGGGGGGTNYSNPFGTWDLYWGVGNAEKLNVATFEAIAPSSPRHDVFDAFSGGGNTRPNSIRAGGLNGFNTYAITNDAPAADGTNVDRVIQVIYASVPEDTNVVLRAGFENPDGTTPPAFSAVVEYSLADFDVVSGRPFINYLTFFDHSATSNNFILSRNLQQPGFFRPSPYDVARSVNFSSLFFDSPNIGDVEPNTYYGSTMAVTSATNTSVTNGMTNINITFTTNSTSWTNREVDYRYAAYSFMVDSGIGRLPTFNTDPALARAFYDPTNLPGRVEIFGGNLNLDRTRVRGENTIWIEATNSFSARTPFLDAPNIILNLHSTNATILLSNTFPLTVKRLNGTVQAWSGVWSNQQTVTMTSDAVTNSTIYNVRFHVLIINGNTGFSSAGGQGSLHGTEPVRVTRFFTESDNLVLATPVLAGSFTAITDDLLINNVVTVDESFVLDAFSLTLTTNGSLNFGGQLTDFSSFHAPRLTNFTNFGSVFIPENLILGLAPNSPLENIVNEGNLSAGGILLRSDYLRNTGFLSANAIELEAVNGEIGGFLSSFSDITLIGNNLSFSNSFIQTSGILTLNVTDSIQDSDNFWNFVQGMQLLKKPATGDLLRSTLNSFAGNFMEARQVWAGQDRGVSSSGYLNNAAVGRLILDGTNTSLFSFVGTGTSNAIYIDYLEFQNAATNFIDLLEISPNMVVYFADSNLPIEKLDGAHGGRLRWVPTYAGLFSSTNIVYPSGRTYTFNAAAARSPDLDSDGDGIMNAFDPTPFFTRDQMNVTVVPATNPPPRMIISWNTVPNSTNIVDYRTSLFAGAWQLLTNFVQGPLAERVSVSDPLNGSFKFYRVRIEP